MSTAQPASQRHVVETNLPFRLDRLPWSRWHTVLVLALGITWVLDGLEVTIVGDVSATLQKHSALALTAAQIGDLAAAYVAGAVVGALFFGYLTDRLGRKKLFMVTLAWYLVFSVLTGFSWSFMSIMAFRFLTGVGIGGEYAAINSAIDELIPARRRGVTDLSINSSFWLGSIIASAATIALLNPSLVPEQYGWRAAFWIGGIIAIGVMAVRTAVPESPRWLLTHGKTEKAEEVVANIEAHVKKSLGTDRLPPPPDHTIKIEQRGPIGFGLIATTMFMRYPKRTFVSLSLFVTQAFLYNAVFFTFGITLSTFFKVPAAAVPIYIIGFALGNLVGPWILGTLFDSIGRRAMISLTYIVPGLLLIATGEMFIRGMLNAVTITIAYAVIFFIASAGASSAYLTVSEIFPMETRALAIGFAYAIGTLAGGISGPLLFGRLVGSGKPSQLFIGFLIGAGLMIAGGLIEAIFGVDAERKSLEHVASPLSAVSEESPGPSLQPA